MGLPWGSSTFSEHISSSSALQSTPNAPGEDGHPCQGTWQCPQPRLSPPLGGWGHTPLVQPMAGLCPHALVTQLEPDPQRCPPALPALEAFLQPGHLCQLAPATPSVIQELTEPGQHLLTQRADGHAPVPHPVQALPPPAWAHGGDKLPAGDRCLCPTGHCQVLLCLCAGRLRRESIGNSSLNQVTPLQEPSRVLASQGTCWDQPRMAQMPLMPAGQEL